MAIRSDNGPPFASPGVGGLSRLAVWWIKLGIRPERIVAGKPQQNGRHERVHRTLKQETAMPPADSLPAQQQRFEGVLRSLQPRAAARSAGATDTGLAVPALAAALPATA